MTMLTRRTVLAGMGAAATVGLWTSSRADALGLDADKIKAIRYYKGGVDSLGRSGQPMVNQSANVVVIETERGLIGVGEGGEPRTLEECASMLIGMDPFRIDRHWQQMMRGMFYPAGREKLHSLGALDLALWDIKGKALGVPVYQLLGGKSRNYVECYATAYPRKPGWGLADAAKACIQQGFRVYRHSTDSRDPVIDRFKKVRDTFNDCVTLQNAVGDGSWALDFHTELDPPDALRLAAMIDAANLQPYFIEDLIRSENVDAYEKIRVLTKVPIAVGEQFGYKWDASSLIEKNLINYLRTSLSNCGGITEYMKLIALCETHYVGMVPHFTSPIGEAGLVHCLAATTVPALMEMTGDGTRSFPYLPKAYDFHEGKMWPNDRPGLGVEIDLSKLTKIGEYTKYSVGMPQSIRPDGSYSQW